MQTLNIPPEIVQEYEKFLKRNSATHHIVMNLTDDQTTLQIVPNGIIASGADSWKQLNELMDAEASYFVFFTVNYNTDDGLKKEEKSLFMYTPESAPTATKMVYAQSKGQIQAKCNKLHNKFEFHGIDEVTEENLISKSKK